MRAAWEPFDPKIVPDLRAILAPVNTGLQDGSRTGPGINADPSTSGTVGRRSGDVECAGGGVNSTWTSLLFAC